MKVFYFCLKSSIKWGFTISGEEYLEKFGVWHWGQLLYHLWWQHIKKQGNDIKHVNSRKTVGNQNLIFVPRNHFWNHNRQRLWRGGWPSSVYAGNFIIYMQLNPVVLGAWIYPGFFHVTGLLWSGIIHHFQRFWMISNGRAHLMYSGPTLFAFQDLAQPTRRWQKLKY